MFSPILFLTITLVLVQAELSSRIVDGDYAKEGQFPYIAQINRNLFCYAGGTIIGPKTILTAAHALKNADVNALTVTVGSNNIDEGGKTYKVESFVYHEDYRTNRNDVGIIKLEEEIEFDNKTIKQIALNRKDIYEYDLAVAAGWGRVDDTNRAYDLKYANMQILPRDKCLEFKSTGVEGNQDVCFVSTHGNVCLGDSGGPLATEDGELLLGVTSWGWNPCGIQHPGVFARVDYFIDWIEKHMD